MKVKICGITHPEDALFAAEYGADYIGVIFSKKSKRAVSLEQAKKIHLTIQMQNVEMVGVFVDESAEEILKICNKINIHTIQLHGRNAREQLHFLQTIYTIFYAIPQEKEEINPLPLKNNIMLLFDNHQPGSGHSFDWEKFTPPQRPWILAGGLNKDNVAIAIKYLNPSIVDVASGVEYANSIRKNPMLVKAFINETKARTF